MAFWFFCLIFCSSIIILLAYIYIYIYIYTHTHTYIYIKYKFGGRVYLGKKVLNAVVAELSIYKWKNQRGRIDSVTLNFALKRSSDRTFLYIEESNSFLCSLYFTISLIRYSVHACMYSTLIADCELVQFAIFTHHEIAFACLVH